MLTPRTSVLDVLVLTCALASAVPFLGACGGDDSAPPSSATCAGAGCDCDAAGACRCSAGDDCHAECGAEACSLTCETGTKCNATSTDSVTIDCRTDAECKGNGGPGSVIVCDGSTKCELKADVDSTATCRNEADCKIQLGAGSTVTCSDKSSCDIKCDGDCAVTCSATNKLCKLDCGTDDAAVATTCPGGRLVCGDC